MATKCLKPNDKGSPSRSGAPPLCADVAMVLLNRDDAPRSLSALFQEMRLPAAGVKKVRDVLHQVDRPDEHGHQYVTAELATHEVEFLRIMTA